MAGPDVRVKLSAEGVQEVIDAMRKIQEEAKNSGESGGEGFKRVNDELEKTFTLTNRARSELIVLAHEALQGRFSRVPGSFMVLSESLGSVGASMLAVAGYAAGVGAAIYAVAKAAHDGAAEFNAMNRAIQLTGSYSGVTIGQLRELAQSISDHSRQTIGSTEKMMTVLVGSGKITAGALDKVAAISAKIADQTGEDADKVAGQLVRMFSDPAKAAEELNGQYHFLSAEQIEHIHRMQEENNLAGAQKALADEYAGQLDKVTVHLGYVDRALNATAKGFSSFWHAVKGIGSDDPEKELDRVRKQIEMMNRGEYGDVGFDPKFRQDLLQKEAELTKQVADLRKESTKATAASNQNQEEENRRLGYAETKLHQINDLKSQLRDYKAHPESDPELESYRQDKIKNLQDQITMLERKDNKEEVRSAREAAEVRAALLAQRLQGLENERAAVAKAMQQETETEKHAYDTGKLTLDAYYRERSRIINAATDQEIAILRKKVSAEMASETDPNSKTAAIKRQTAELKLQGEIEQLNAQRKVELETLAVSRAQDEKKLADQRLAAEEAIARLKGDKAGAARMNLDRELEQLRDVLDKGGTPKDESDKLLQQAKAQGEAKISYDEAKSEAKSEADAALTELQTKIKAIQDQVKDGLLFPAQGEEKIAQLERDELPILDQKAAKLKEVAKQTKDATDIAHAEQYAEKVKQIKTATDDWGPSMAKLKQTSESALESGLAGFLENVTNGTMKISDAFKKMARDFAQSLIKMEAEWASKQFIKWLLNKDGSQNGQSQNPFSTMVQGGQQAMQTIQQVATAKTTADTTMTASSEASAAATEATQTAAASSTEAAWTPAATAASIGSFGAAAAIGLAAVLAALAIRKFATGGHIRGPGTSTSDSIPAMLSDGEFVVNAGAVQKPGVLALLHAINGTPGITPKAVPGVHMYAGGGEVMGGGAGGVQKHYHVDASTVPHHIVQAAVNKAVLDVIAKNPVKVRNAIG